MRHLNQLKKYNQKGGFTLIELLVVISIIGLLSTVVLGAVASARVKAYEARTKTELAQIRIILEQYYDQYGGYPYPGNNAFYCLGGECVFAGTSGDVLNSLAINLQPEPMFIAAVAVPNFTGRMITVDGVSFSGYSYLPCTDPVDSGTAESGSVCPGNTAGTDVSIVTPVGDTVKSVSASNSFQIENYTYSEDDGSDSGSDSGSDGGPTDYDSDGIPDSSDNCIYVFNSDQTDNNGYEDYSGNGDACEPITSDSGSDSGSDEGSDEGGGITDTDSDGVPDSGDNCVYVSNSTQADNNGFEDFSGDGDACEVIGS